MALPAPTLDDRTFQDLVDDAKRLVQQRCPDWSDHNVSDPGVTLIEAVAQMLDQVLYRLNRVPERHYLKFLELIGVTLRPPGAARGEVTFWLSAPQPQPVVVRAETEVATARTDVEDPVVLTTVRDLVIPPCDLTHVATQNESATTDRTAELRSPDARPDAPGPEGFACFSDVPQPGDALLVGLSGPAPGCALVLRLDCPVAGVGVDPLRPPTRWQAWTAEGWIDCDVQSDGTGGLNQQGDVVLHVPSGHTASAVAQHRAGWLRCVVVDGDDDQPPYLRSPVVRSATAWTRGGTVEVVHAEVVRDEDLGTSEGVPAQRFALQRRPVVASDTPTVLEVRDGDEVTRWSAVSDFAASGPDDRHFRLDATAGEVHLGPAVRLADGSLRSYGLVPPRGSRLRLLGYRTGGGRRGNVATGQVRVLKTSVPYIARVENRRPAVGGADAETVEDAKVRGPLVLRSRGRAVTAEDFEELARQVAPEAARVTCLAADDEPGVRLLVVPQVSPDRLGRVDRADLVPPEATLARICDELDARRLVGTRLHVQQPDYRWVTAIVEVSARPGQHREHLREEVTRALYRFFSPITGGPERRGWPFGRSVRAHEVVATLAQLPGVDMSSELRVLLFPRASAQDRPGEQTTRIDLPPDGLVFSHDHQVQVRR